MKEGEKHIPVFHPKEEYTKIEFDENVRFRVPEMMNTTVWHYLYGHIPPKDPMSTYASVNHKGKTYHLFNAKRFPIGRMAAMIS